MAEFSYYTQLDQMDCGPTCLRMIAKHYGKSFSVQTLRDKSQIGKEGTSLLGLSEAAESIGFRTLGLRLSFDKLVEEAPLPCIVHWDQSHFVVVYDVKKSNTWMARIKGGFRTTTGEAPRLDPDTSFLHASRSLEYVSGNEIIIPAKPKPPLRKSSEGQGVRAKVTVADPAQGILTYTADEFCKHWHNSNTSEQNEGVVLLLEPTPAFYEQEDEKTTTYGFGKLLDYLWQYRKLLFQLVLGLLVGSGLQLIMPFLMQSVVDTGINNQNISFIYLVLGAQLVLMFGRLSVDFIRSWILLHISTRINLSILSDFLMKLMRLPLSFFDTKHFGDIMQRIGDHQRIEAFLTSQTLNVVFSLFSFIIFGLVLAFYHVAIFGVFLLTSVLYVGWIILFLRQRRKLDVKRFGVSAKSQSALIQLIQGMQEIKLAGAERYMRWAWERLQARLFRLQMKNLALSQYQQAGAFLLNDGKNILLTLLAAQAVIAGQLSLGAMLAIQYIIGQLNSPLEQLVNFIKDFQDAKISLERLNEIHTLQEEENTALQLSAEIPQQATLQLKNISFRYPGAGNDPVLDAISLTIPQGRTTAIVGMSGSGKTTLLKLLLKMYDPSAGEIKLGNMNFRNLSPSVWRSQCGVVMQEGFIFSDTIARNIAVGVERIDAKRLEQAVHIANLSDFIEGLPAGYHTKIGTEGSGISQGQKQRILIARAVYKNPQYIFFDEATNALDANNESIIMEQLNSFFAGRTVVVVAHRLSTVKGADQIVVLHKGAITELGTHQELVAKKGDYWQLVKNQLELSA